MLELMLAALTVGAVIGFLAVTVLLGGMIRSALICHAQNDMIALH